jgi:WD40 repeat protein
VPGDVATVAFGPFLRLAYYSTSGLAAVQGALGGTWHRKVQLPPGQVWAADLSPDASVLALGFDGDQAVRLYRSSTGEQWHDLAQGFHRSISAIAFSPDSRMIAVGSYDQRVRVFEVATGSKLADYQAHGSPVYALAWSPDSRLLASGAKTVPRDRGSAGITLAVQTWQGERLAGKNTGFTVEALAFSPDGGTIAYGGAARSIGLWRPEMGARMASRGGARARSLPSTK